MGVGIDPGSGRRKIDLRGFFTKSFRPDVRIKMTAGIFRIHNMLPLISENEPKLKDEKFFLRFVFPNSEFFGKGQAIIKGA